MQKLTELMGKIDNFTFLEETVTLFLTEFDPPKKVSEEIKESPY